MANLSKGGSDDAAPAPASGREDADRGGGREGEGFDQVIERLRGVVEKLEGGSLSLEQSLSAFEDGVRLSRRGGEILDRAERRVEMLSRGATGYETVPFPDTDAVVAGASGGDESTGKSGRGGGGTGGVQSS